MLSYLFDLQSSFTTSKVAKFGAIFELFSYWWVFIEWIDTIIDYNPIVKVFRRGGRVLLCSAGVSGSN